MDQHRMKVHDGLMLVSYIPVHAALDIVVLTNFDVPASSIYVVFAVNVVLAFTVVSLVFWIFDRLRITQEEAASEP